MCIADACFSGTWDKKSNLQSKAMSDHARCHQKTMMLSGLSA
jgi:hypothetical protein